MPKTNVRQRARMTPMLKIRSSDPGEPPSVKCYIWRIDCIELKHGHFGSWIRCMWKILNCGAKEGQRGSAVTPFV